jgi:hypothetical protein
MASLHKHGKLTHTSMATTNIRRSEQTQKPNKHKQTRPTKHGEPAQASNNKTNEREKSSIIFLKWERGKKGVRSFPNLQVRLLSKSLRIN